MRYKFGDLFRVLQLSDCFVDVFRSVGFDASTLAESRREGE